ncbi:MAG: hypothetical protein HY720_00080 [Planctomycetes bacterium]|nr:hypothetical protein [Planctomycetota bacterium]
MSDSRVGFASEREVDFDAPPEAGSGGAGRPATPRPGEKAGSSQRRRRGTTSGIHRPPSTAGVKKSGASGVYDRARASGVHSRRLVKNADSKTTLWLILAGGSLALVLTLAALVVYLLLERG